MHDFYYVSGELYSHPRELNPSVKKRTRFFMLALCAGASAEKFPGGGGQSLEKNTENYLHY